MIKNYLVTGGLGFIGSYVIEELLKLGDDIRIYNVDMLGVGSDRNNIKDDYRVTNLYMDIADDKFMKHLPKIDFILHLAAESHVDRSILNPLAFIDSNVKGTANILEIARKDSPRMVHVSTDEVYGHLLPGESPFTEEHPLKPRSPYSASKASADLLVLSYVNTYGVDVSITRCCNNYGPRQHDEKLIPTVVRSIVGGWAVPVYGTGENIREWIHAGDHAKAILEVLEVGEKGQAYNIAGKKIVSNLELVNHIISIIEKNHPQYSRDDDYIAFVGDRLGHDFKYELTSRHDLQTVKEQRDFCLADTVDYYVKIYSKYSKIGI